MAIITISRGSYSRGKEVAEGVADTLGYECISRDLILEASESYNIPEVKLVRAIYNAPSILESLGSNKTKYVSFFRAALLRKLQSDNKVYHGLAGHFFLSGVSHVLKVRIIADMEDRVRLEMDRENISEKEALKVLKKDDEQRRKWSLSLYGIDTNDPSLYHMVLHIGHLSVSDAVKIICHAAALPRFATTPASQQFMDDLAVQAEVAGKLINWRRAPKVFVKRGHVEIEVESAEGDQRELSANIVNLVSRVEGVKHVSVKVIEVDR